MALAAAETGSSGGLGLLIVVIFLIVAVVLFVFMSRSMRRMRSNVDRGRFGAPPSDTSDSTRATERQDPPRS